MINQERLSETFKMLAETDSTSRNELEISEKIATLLKDMGAEVERDNAGSHFGGNAGNIYAKFPGNRETRPLLLNAHMDTVEPGRGVRAVLKEGVFYSEGDTILGADDKSAIAILLEVMRVVRENDLPHGPVELVLTVSEEIGLLGAKHLEMERITAPYGFALDTTGTDVIITRAPGANKFELVVHGKEAHAGAAPENGISAIAIAATAISRLRLGRVNAETTCNIGTIRGGTATNIIPNRVTLNGEVRSHDPDLLESLTKDIIAAFETAADHFRKAEGDELPRIEVSVTNDFSRTHIPDDHPVVQLARKASENLGRGLATEVSGGGADANVFFGKGIVVGVLGTGMTDMHTVNESVAVADMVRTAELVIEILKVHAGG